MPGTDPRAPEKLEKFTAALGHPCLVLDCAIKKNQDHCFRCSEFPCPVHYEQEMYSKKFLDMIQGMIQQAKGQG